MNRDDLRRALEPFALEGGTCPPLEAILRLTLQKLTDQEAEDLRAHLASCPACLEIWYEARLASSSGQKSPEKDVQTRSRRWEWALAAALAVTLGGLGLSAYKWSALNTETRRLSSELALSARRRPSPAPARLVELMPETFVLRGAAGNSPTLRAGESAALLLVTLEPMPSGAEARLLGADGKALWTGPLPESLGASTVLHVPPGILVPGACSVEVFSPATGAVIHRFPFSVTAHSPR
jgi:hypothetical protein